MNVLITGMAGFAGSHLLEHLLKETDWNITGIVSFRHKGDSLRFEINAWDSKRVNVVYHDLQGPISERLIERIGPIDVIYNLAADSHVDRSIVDPVPFIKNNVDVILNVLEYARVIKPKIFLQCSTDEIYGPAPTGVNFKEWSSIIPSNPYSASKAMQEDAVIAYWRTYGVPAVITNTMNMIGERQDKEKFLPLIISRTAKGEVVPIHGSTEKIGSRFYLHARNYADALLFLTHLFSPGVIAKNEPRVPMYPNADRPARFNVVGEREIDNLALASMVAGFMGKPLKVQLIDWHQSRPGHDLRYALSGDKIRELGWKAPISFQDSVKKTIEWTLKNPEWLK
jgi:dTDP-glucose 4,6-dehydratase